MDVARKLLEVRARVAEAAERSGRPPTNVRVVGVSKGATAERIAEAVRAGLDEVGENRVQEAADKIPRVEALVDRAPQWHLVGHLQSNKAQAALGLFDTIESVDSIRLAQVLSRRSDRRLPVFLEVQFAHTPDRFGFEPETAFDAVVTVGQLPNLDVIGLMTVAPLGLDAEGVRRVFRSLREKRDAFHESRPDLPRLQLSMGMTDDYVIAIEEGSTLVRIGRAIFAD